MNFSQGASNCIKDVGKTEPGVFKYRQPIRSWLL
jgi:hypothetical protein